MKKFMSLCSGGAGADVGATMAGLDHLVGVEIDAKIASVAEMNGYKTIVADIRDVDYSALTRPDWLHASTPCINASVANQNAGETILDMELAQAVCRAIEALKPDYFSLENVRGYATFKAYQAIKECLLTNDYTYIDGILNAADYGTPQTRVRLFLVASRVSTPRLPLPTHYDARSGAMNMLLKPWVGWHEAISDLLDELPETEFAPWQLKRLPDELKTSLLDTMNSVRNATIRDVDEPSYTIKANHMRRPSTQPMAYLINSENAGQQYSDGLRRESQPSMTISTASKPKAYVGRVVKLSPRCLARFNGLGDDYKLPDKQSLACKVLGNMVMPLVMAAIIRSNVCDQS